MENVRMAKPNATREEIAHALEAAQCLDIIEKLPNGIDMAHLSIPSLLYIMKVGKDGELHERKENSHICG